MYQKFNGLEYYGVFNFYPKKYALSIFVWSYSSLYIRSYITSFNKPWKYVHGHYEKYWVEHRYCYYTLQMMILFVNSLNPSFPHPRVLYHCMVMIKWCSSRKIRSIEYCSNWIIIISELLIGAWLSLGNRKYNKNRLLFLLYKNDNHSGVVVVLKKWNVSLNL